MSERISVYEQLVEYLEAKEKYEDDKDSDDDDKGKKYGQVIDDRNDLSEYQNIMRRTKEKLMECPRSLLEEYKPEAEYTNDMLEYELGKKKAELRLLWDKTPATPEEQEEKEQAEIKLKSDISALESQYNKGIEQLELLKDILAARGYVESTEENIENEDNDPGSETLDQGPKTFRP